MSALAPPNCPACAMGLTAEFVFNRLDENEDKTVTVQELGRVLAWHDESAATEAVGRIDQDGDGNLSWQEFEAAYKARHANCKPSKPVEGVRSGGRGNATMFARVFMICSEQERRRQEWTSPSSVGAEMGFNRLDQNKNGFIEADELGELHQSRMNDPKTMRERLESGDQHNPL